ncbi:MAG: hypothetical protein IT572_02285 [Deltaproteobacteria bacterium]|nr:hypothetical protein [Deltaproteobacteria bacterium]
MTPPREARNFFLGSSRPLPDLDLNPEVAARLRLAAAAERAEEDSRHIERGGAVDRFSLEPALRYRPDLAGNYREMNDRQLEVFVRDSLAAGRRGERVRYYDAVAGQFALLQRAATDRVPALTRLFVATLEEYSNFLQYAPDLGTEERLRFLFAAARIGHTFLSHFQRPPAGAALPENSEELRSTLVAALDEVDAQLQGYHVRLAAESYPLLPRLRGVSEILGLRRALYHGDRVAQRRHALALAEHLSIHPPTELDTSWHARAERVLLEDREIVAQLRHFDAPSVLEDRAVALNAQSLEWLVLAAASLDRANEESEDTLRARYRGFSAVLTALALRHPEWSLEEMLRRLRSADAQAVLVSELEQTQLRNAEVARMLTEARGTQSLTELTAAARETALHVDRLGYGAGRNLLPGLLEANRRHHPLLRIESEVLRLPDLAAELGLNGSLPGRELLRRRSQGLEQLRDYQNRHPDRPVQGLLRLLQSDGEAPHPAAGLAGELLEAWQGRLAGAADHEAFALHALFGAVEESTPEGGVPAELRARARSLRERSDGAEFRARRVFGHLFSASNLVSLGAGILAAEFLPSLLIARAGAGGSLALRGLPLVARGSLTPWGSVATGLGVGTALSAFGAGAHNLDRYEQGLNTHFWRDFGASAGINLVTFGLTIPFSRILQNRLLAGARDPFLVADGLRSRELAVHAGTVAFGGATALGLGFLGRGVFGGQWSLSGEEVAENVLSIAMWEFGAAGLRHLRGRTMGYAGPLGPHRAARLNELVPALVAREPGLAGREAILSRLLAHGEIRHPGTLERYHQALAEGRIPQLFVTGRRASLRLATPEELPPRPPAAAPGAPLAEPEPPPPPPEPQRPIVIVWEREPILRLPAATASEAPLTPLTPRSEPPGTHPPPISLEESPYRLTVMSDPANAEQGGAIEFGELAEGPESGARILGRGDFRFLSEDLRRTLSRAHLELRLGEDGQLLARNLSRTRTLNPELQDFHGSWYYRDGEWHPIPSEGATPLQAGDTLGIGNRVEPVQFQILQNQRPPISPIRLAPGRRLALGRFRLIRTGEESLFRLAGAGETPVEVIRSLGDGAGERRSYRATDNPVVGEIGEEVFVAVGEGPERRSYRLYLDSPDRPAATLPALDLHYEGVDWHSRFRASEGSIDFGRIHQPELFTAPFISRNHFRISIGSHEGHPRYVLRVEAPHGLAVGNRRFAHGSQVLLMSGVYQLNFPMDSHGRSFAPGQLRLSPIEGSFAEWRTGPLLPNHDRAVSPPPPPPPPPPPLPPRPQPQASGPPQAHPASPARRPGWRNLWGWIED